MGAVVDDIWKGLLAKYKPLVAAPAATDVPPPAPPAPVVAPTAPAPVAISPEAMDAARIAQHESEVRSAPAAPPHERATVGSLVSSLMAGSAERNAARAAAPTEKSKAETDDAAYRERQADSFLSKEQREAKAAKAAAKASDKAGTPEDEATAARLGLGTAAPTNKYASGGSGGGEGGAAAPSINWGGAGGGTATIAAHEQKAVATPRQNQLLGAIGGQKEAATETGDANAETERQKAIGTREVARANEDAGVDMRLRAQVAKDESAAYRKHIDDFSAKLATDKTDHNRLWNDQSMGGKIALTVAKGLGAFGQAFLHTSTNQVADSIDAMVAGDVADQRAKHEMGREHLADMKSAYAQALQTTGDAEQAERVATGYALEAAKQNALALTQDAGSAVQRARGKELTAAIDEKIAEKGIVMNPYVQAKTVSTGGPDMKVLAATAKHRIETQAALGITITPDEAFRYAVKMETGRDPMSGAGAFAGGSKAEAGGKKDKLDEARTTVQGGIGTIDRALNTGAAYKQGPIGALWAHVPGATQSKMDELERKKYNAQVKALVGAGWKMTTDGMEPKNPGIIEELSEHYQIQPTDSDELARQRMNDLKDTLRDAGTSKGVLFDETRKDLAGIPEAFKPGESRAPAAPSSLAPVGAPKKK